jgi:L-alanine-DL-glutamate epimerase-like enolase superfamily enzyme
MTASGHRFIAHVSLGIISSAESQIMQIRRLTAYRQWQPFRDGTYTCSGGRSAEGFDSLIIRLETDQGITGWGEMAPLGAFYDPAFAAAARAGFLELAPLLIGSDPRAVNAITARMDLHLKGHPYVKSAIDMACWDAKSKSAGLPLAEALGGRFGESVDLYRSIAQMAPDLMAERARKYRAEGYRRLQVKVGLDPDEDITRIEAVRAAIGGDVTLFADANGGWSTHQARRFLRATRQLDYYLEQPCASYDENRALRPDCDRPLILDESIDSLRALLQAQQDRVVDGITIKISRVGGITRAARIRDVAVELGLAVTVEDTGGAEIDTAAMIHLSLSTPEAQRLHTVDFHNWVTTPNGRGIPAASHGTISIGSRAGLGIDVLIDVLGEPIASFGA